MTAALVEQVRQIFEAGVAAVDPERVIAENLQRLPNGGLRIAGTDVAISDSGVYIIALGKAAPAMIAAAESVLGDSFTAGVGVAKSIPDGLEVRTRLIAGSHPIPDEQSLEAGQAVAEFAGAIPEGAITLCLISGGGSALIESLRPGITLDDLRAVTSRLLNAGADIYELNAVRSRLSEIKSGGLLGKLAGRRVFNLILSDVLGDDPAVIASGPTVPREMALDANDVLARYGVEFDLPPLDEQPETSVETVIVGNLQRALNASASEAKRLGYRPVVLSASLQGEAREVAGVLGSIIVDSVHRKTAFGRGDCLLAGGETTVTVGGDGSGGRNTESALAAALRIEGTADVAAGFLATDGDDAATGVAGGIVTGATIGSANRVAARQALDKNDSFTFLWRAGATWGNGPTGTNVNDLIICLLGGALDSERQAEPNVEGDWGNHERRRSNRRDSR